VASADGALPGGGRPPARGRLRLALALSYAGLLRLGAPGLELLGRGRHPDRSPYPLGGAAGGGESSFKADCIGCSVMILGDPVAGRGSPGTWRVGGADPRTRPHAAVVVAGGTDGERRDGVAWIRDQVAGAARLIHVDLGDHLPQRREHFGFVDGIARPLVDAVVLPRRLPLVEVVAAPAGTRVYPVSSLLLGSGGGAPGEEIPAWARRGSFLVYRRLEQDVGAFHRFVRRVARRLGWRPARVAAHLFGRWPGGAPLARFPRGAPRRGAADDRFDFESDPAGRACPFSAHIRKCNPRHLDPSAWRRFPPLFRRGVPFGPPTRSTFTRPASDGRERGLLFLAYQASIEDQFELIMRGWINDSSHPAPGAGVDPIVGSAFGARRRPVAVGGRTFAAPSFVFPTGGGYFFAPSLSGLRAITAARVLTKAARAPDP
jgi:Dyp-type peroxidase family